MIPDARVFPGIAVVNSGFQSGGAVSSFSTTLPTPAAGLRQYLTLAIISFRGSGPSVETMNITFTNLDLGGGTINVVQVQTLTSDGKVYPQLFSPAWPANGLATAIGVTIQTSAGANFSVNNIVCSVNLFGYNVPE